MTEYESYGMPRYKIIAGKRYEYNEPASSKSDAERRAKWLRESGWHIRIVHQKFHGYDKYHLYFRD